MKNILFLAAIFFSLNAAAQKPTTKGNFKEYITRSNDTIRIGDTITFGIPANGQQYIFITQGNAPCSAHISGDIATISKLKSIGNKQRGYKMYAQVKGYGLIPVSIEIENAIRMEEIEL